MRISALTSAIAVVAALSPAGAQGPQDLTTQLIDGLNKANLTAIAALASSHADALVSSGKLSLLLTPGGKTLLAPSNAAIAKMGTKLSNATPKQIEAILMYHVVNGTISYNNLPSSFDYQIVAPTLLNDTIFTNLPNGQDQVLVFTRQDSRNPITISYGHGKTNFTETHDGPSVGSLTIQTINDVLIPPANFSLLAQLEPELLGMSVPFDRLNLTSSITSSTGLTIFAPTLEAFKGVQNKMLDSNATRFKNILKNHIVNGTVVYSVQMPNQLADNNKATTTKVTELHTAAGSLITLTYSATGQLQVTSGNFTANVVKMDTLLSNGVVYLIDQVLLNDQVNKTLAANTSEQISKPVPDVASQSTAATADTHAHSANGASTLPAACAFLPVIMAVAALLTIS